MEAINQIIAKLKQYPVLVACGVVILIAGAVILVRRPNVATLEFEVQEKVDNWSKIQRNTERSIGLQADLEMAEVFKENIAERLLVEEEVAINYAYFYEMERVTGSRIVTILQDPVLDQRSRPPQIPNMKNHALIPYNITVEGTFAQIVDFIHRLENGDYFLRADGVNVTGAGRAADAPLVARLKLYVLGELQK